MRISAVIQIAKQYLVVGCLAVILFLIGYFVVYRRLLKGTKKLNLKQITLIAILIIYAGIVLGATLGIRSSGFEETNFHLFSSYIEAWNSFSLREWRLLILNILMFVPLGFLLPLLFKKCENWYITYAIGLASTLFIETVQFISKRGIFELDDILNNTIGCMIGYGIAMIFIIVFKNKNQKNKTILTIAYQIPIIITVTIFSVIFINYSKQELGNLSITNSYKV
ncbi:MAG: VanZ family protein, partial [Peptostreptococcaceae bacterium]